MRLWTDYYEEKVSKVEDVIEHAKASAREHNEQFPEQVTTHWPFSFGRLEFEYNRLVGEYNVLLQNAKAAAECASLELTKLERLRGH